jgi:tetratricopeptide (TPR) repeat protein
MSPLQPRSVALSERPEPSAATPAGLGVRRLARGAVAITLLASMAVPASPAAAQDAKKPASGQASDEASERFRAGVGFYKDGDFTAALVEFKRAYELAPNYRVLFNLGQTSQELNDYASALTAFEQYLAQGGKDVDAKRKKEVETWIASLKKKVARVQIEASVEGAELSIDDVSVGSSPLSEPVVVNAGRRKFGATLAGHTPVTRVVEIAGSDETTISLELVPIEATKTIEVPVDRPGPTETRIVERSSSPAPWVALSITAASAIATGVFGGLALSASGERDDELARFPGNASAISDASDRTATFALATDVLAGITIAGAITTVVLFAVTSSSDEAVAADQASIELRVVPTGLVLGGSF